VAVVQELIAKLGFQVDQAGLQKADNGLKSMASSALKMFAAYQLAAKSFGLVVESVKGAARLEAMNAEFEVMLGNAEAAKYLVQQINQFAAVTPFETEGLVSNVRLMMAFGQSANEALGAVKMLGDVAGSDQERLNRLSLAYAQVMAAGKLQGQDLLQFVNAGFNPLQELSKKTGKSIGDLRKEMEKGNISAAMVSEAFASATGPGGRFFGNMNKQSQTLLGLWSTLRDNFKMMMAELGGRLVPFIKEIINAFIPLMDGIAGAYRQLGDFFALMFSDGPTAMDYAAGIAAAFQTIADAIMAVGASFQFILYAVDIIQGAFATVFGFIFDTIMAIPKAVAYAVKGVIAAGDAIASLLPGGADNRRRGAASTAKLDRFIGTGFGEYTSRGFTNASEAGNARLAKALELSSMIGGTKDAAPGSKVTMTDAILKALQGNSKVVNSTVNVNNTIHAEGTMLDVLQQQANSVFGLSFQQRLIASAV